tara:strand:- start:396 stop:737 length:342 start_codon:yes stop_codon:yes gene_type:complete
MYINVLIISVIIIAFGCTNIPDLQTISLLNQRISSLENNEHVEECVGGIATPVNVLSVAETMEIEDTVIWLLMSNGGMIPIRFYIEKGRWVGPLGDHYFHKPTKKQLDILYKK